MSYGGCVGLSIPDNDKLEKPKALAALGLLWGSAAHQVLANIPRDGSETGATFTGADEDYTTFAAALLGTGVEVELLMSAPTRAMLKILRGDLVG